MRRSYDVGQGSLFVGVGPLVDAGKRWLLHGKVTTGAIPRRFGDVMRAGGGYEEYEGSRKPVLYFGIHLLHTLARIIGESIDPRGSPQVPGR